VLLQLATLPEEAREDAVLDALPALAPLDMIRWMRLKRQLKTAVPALNLYDLERARQGLRRTAAQQTTPAAGRSQAQMVLPPRCAICGGVERWDDQGTMRCVTCWPWDGNRSHAGADMAASTPGTTRGNEP
jgi:hypothetical protein